MQQINWEFYVNEVLRGHSINAVAKEYGVSRSALQRYVRMARSPHSEPVTKTTANCKEAEAPVTEQVAPVTESPQPPVPEPAVTAEQFTQLQQQVAELSVLIAQYRIERKEPCPEPTFDTVVVDLQLIKGYYNLFEHWRSSGHNVTYTAPVVRVLGVNGVTGFGVTVKLREPVRKGTPIWVWITERWDSYLSWNLRSVHLQEPREQDYRGVHKVQEDMRKANSNHHDYIIQTYVG